VEQSFRDTHHRCVQMMGIARALHPSYDHVSQEATN
jgi:hypothetical protein